VTIDDERVLGTCPDCGSVVRCRDELIAYERADDTTGVFAECPACGEVVSPSDNDQ